MLPSSQDISMATTTLKTNVVGHCIVDLSTNGRVYTSTRLGVLKNLCSDLILGQDLQKQHKSVIEFDGSNPELVIPKTKSVSALSAASIGEPSLFANLPECKRMATKSRHFSRDDKNFIEQEGITEPSRSPGRALVVVVKDP